MSNAINSNNSNSTILSVAIAILQHQDKFLMQLRDDIPTIVHPGMWTFFGGHIELGEDPEICIRRELKEEIKYVPEQMSLCRSYLGDQVIRHVFYARLDVGLDMLELGEGWDMDLLSDREIIKGSHYSSVALQKRPIAASHKQIMLDFLSSSERRINM